MLDGHGQAAADEPDWEAVQAVYEAGEVPIEALCRQFGITRYRLAQKRLEGRWRTRPQVAHPPPGVPRRPIELAIENIVRLIAVQARRLAAAPGRVPAEELVALTGLAKAAEGLMREDARSQQRSPQGGGSISSRKAAVGGGFATAEEARAADVAFMRAEIKRRIAVLRRSAGLDGADRPAGGE